MPERNTLTSPIPRAGPSISSKAQQARASWLGSPRPRVHLQAGIALTVLLQVELPHSVDVTELCNASLDLCPSFSPGHVDLLDHLLLPVDPVQPVLKHGEAHRLQDVGVFQNDPVGTCRRETMLWLTRKNYQKHLLHYSHPCFSLLLCYWVSLLQNPRPFWVLWCKTNAFCRQMIKNFFFCFHQEVSFCAQKIPSVVKKHLEWGAHLSWAFPVPY